MVNNVLGDGGGEEGGGHCIMVAVSQYQRNLSF